MDCLLLPTAGTTYTIAEMLADPVALNTNLGAYTNFVNLMDLAALAVPAGFRARRHSLRRDADRPCAVRRHACRRSATPCTARSPAPRLGATSISLVIDTACDRTPAKPATSVKVAVVGAHLSGQPLNWQLVERKAKLLETTRTGPGYRLYALADTSPPKPGLVFDGTGAGGIEVEVWEMDEGAFGSFVALIPAPFGIGTVTLADGRTVKGFLCETYATIGAEDITAFGGWRAWLGRRIRASRRARLSERGLSPPQSGDSRARQPGDANLIAEDSGSMPLPAYRVSRLGKGDAILPQCLCNFIKTGIFRLLLGGWLVV